VALATVRGLSVVLLVLAALVAYGLMDNRWYKVVAVEGNSMAPAFHAGDAVVITRPPSQVEVGMVLMLEVDGDLVTHRVVEVRDDGSFVTKGDANDEPDDYSLAESIHVVGRVRLHVPGLGDLIGHVQDGLPRTSAWWVDADSSGANTLRVDIPGGDAP
jgi:signal peptidase